MWEFSSLAPEQSLAGTGGLTMVRASVLWLFWIHSVLSVRNQKIPQPLNEEELHHKLQRHQIFTQEALTMGEFNWGIYFLDPLWGSGNTTTLNPKPTHLFLSSRMLNPKLLNPTDSADRSLNPESLNRSVLLVGLDLGRQPPEPTKTYSCCEFLL